jgi:hypothetical protein
MRNIHKPQSHFSLISRKEYTMVQFHSTLAAITLATALAACGDVGTTSSPPVPTAPVAPVSPVADPTISPLPSTPAPTTDAAARGTDSTASNTTGVMSKTQESESMPMAGQGNSHSSPSLDPAKR